VPTRNNLNSNAKTVSIQVLGDLLADGIDLALLTQQAHWNLKGPRFIARHEMLDGFRTELDVHVDTMAERIVQIGGIAVGTAQGVGAGTRLAPYPMNIQLENEHLLAADILTGYSRALDKALWFLEAQVPA
jgi:starvation-inducible DNA-binding protein